MDDVPIRGKMRRVNGVIAATALAVILMALFVFPGFEAGLWSRWGGGIRFTTEGDWHYGNNRLALMQKAVFSPSGILMRKSKQISEFYVWQFRMTGARVVYFDDVSYNRNLILQPIP